MSNVELVSKKKLPVVTTKVVTETLVSALTRTVLMKTSERTSVKDNTVKTKTVLSAETTLTVVPSKSAETMENATVKTNFVQLIQKPLETSVVLKIKKDNVLNAELEKLQIAAHSKVAIQTMNVPAFLTNALNTLLA